MWQILRLRLHLNRIFWSKSSSAQKLVASAFVIVLLGVMFGVGVFAYQSFRFLLLSDGGGIELAFYALSIGLTLLFALFTVASFVSYQSLAFSASDLELFFSLPLKPSQIASEKLVENWLLSGWGIMLLGLPVVVGLGLNVHGGVAYYLTAVVALIILSGLAAMIGSVLAVVMRLWFTLTSKLFTRIFAIIAVFLVIRLIGLIVLPDIALIDSVVSAGLPFTLQSVTRPLVQWLPSYQLSVLVGSTVGVVAPFFGVIKLLFEVAIIGYVGLKIIHHYYLKSWQNGYEVLPEVSLFSATSFFANRRFLWEKREIIQLLRDLRSGGQLAFLAILLAFCLLVLGFTYGVRDVPVQWQAGILALLVGVFGYCLATLALRFIFPTISLESRSIWLVWSSPVNLERLILAKWVVSLGLIMSSAVVLGVLCLIMLPFALPIKLLVCAYLLILAAMIGSIQLGLGLSYPNFHESDPGALSTTGPGLVAVVISLLLVTVSALTVRQDVTRMMNGDYTASILHLILWLGATIILVTGWMKHSYKAAKGYTF